MSASPPTPPPTPVIVPLWSNKTVSELFFSFLLGLTEVWKELVELTGSGGGLSLFLFLPHLFSQLLFFLLSPSPLPLRPGCFWIFERISLCSSGCPQTLDLASAVIPECWDC